MAGCGLIHFCSIHLLKIRKEEGGILLKPEREKKRNIKDFFALKVERTGNPEWATPEEIKSIWE